MILQFFKKLMDSIVVLLIILISICIIIPISLFTFLLVNGTGWIFDKIRGISNAK